MLLLVNVSKSFDGQEILNDISLSLKNGEVVGLIGQNGAGKTTLFKIITGEIYPDKGTIDKGQEIIGYLPQHLGFNGDSVHTFLSNRLGNSAQGYKINKVLGELGLASLDQLQPADNLSGGEKTRLYLATLLLADPGPTALILDEPTNNLDIDGLEWLEKFIKNFPGIVFLTSHDRAFLDKTVDRIVELDKGQIKNYGGNYTFYRGQKLLEKKAYLEKYERNVEEIKKLERLIAAKRQRIKEISKDKGREHEKFEKAYFRDRVTKKASGDRGNLLSRLNRTEKLEKPQERIHHLLGFLGKIPADKFIIGAKNVSKGFSDHVVLNKVNVTVTGSGHVWLSGANGSGKTTLLKILAGKILPDEGIIEVGNGVKVRYFSQEIPEPNLNKTGLELLMATGNSETECFKRAMDLHIESADLRKPISSLSRGQMAKLELVKLLLEQNQLLILDEPTNHLEIETREEIEEALKNYQGAILVASHDRYFLREIGIDRQLMLRSGKLEEVFV